MFWSRDILWRSHYILNIKGKVWVITNGRRIENKEGNTFFRECSMLGSVSLHFVVEFDTPHQFSQFELCSCAAQAASALMYCIYEFWGTTVAQFLSFILRPHLSWVKIKKIQMNEWIEQTKYFLKEFCSFPVSFLQDFVTTIQEVLKSMTMFIIIYFFLS